MIVEPRRFRVLNNNDTKFALVSPLPPGEGQGEGIFPQPHDLPHPNPLPEGEGGFILLRDNCAP